MAFLDRCIASAAASLLVIVAASPDASAAVCKIPGFDQAAFGDVSVDMGNGCTDSFDSSLGGYGSTVCAPNPAGCVGGVATNGSSSGSISINSPNGCVAGGCTIGYGGTATGITGSSECNGTAVQSAPVVLQSVNIPTYPAAATTPATWPATITPSFTYGNMGSSGNASEVLTLNGSGDYVVGNFNMSGQASLTLTAGTKAVVYVTGTTLDLAGNGINNPSGKPTDLVFMCADSVTSVSIVGNANSSFGLYCPKANITVAGNGTVYGAIVGRTVTLNGNNTMIHYDKALGSMTTGSITCPVTEVSRAQPIVSTLTCGAGECGTAGAGTYTALFQGTFEVPDTAQTSITTTASVSTWNFPYILGHMRARNITAIGTTGSTYSSTGVLFDAGATGKIPAATYGGCSTFTGSCRHIFTNTNASSSTGTTRYPTMTTLSDSTSAAVGALIATTTQVPGITATHYQAIVRKILDGKLGGVDRSTVAVIEESSYVTGGSTRPKMVYFGGTDGMLHAVCAAVGGTTPTGSNICPAIGTELWAFLPRSQLALLRTNEQRIDGSVHVVDSYGDFANPQTGKNGWKTILTFQTGYHKAGSGSFPAAYALDVSDPANPKIVWEYTTPTSAGAADFGTGTDAAAGPTLISSKRTELAVLETNNGGTGGAGVVTVALEMSTGNRKWIFDKGIYPATDLVPATGLPGGAVGMDLLETGFYSHYLFADLKGRVWKVDATNGISPLGASTPLFEFSALYKPIGASPALWSTGGKLYAAFASGGYMDHNNTAWMLGTQYIAVVNVRATTTQNELSPCVNCNVRVAEAIGTGFGSYSTPTIVGDQLFVTVDSSQVNSSTYGTGTTDTGRVYSVDLSSAGSSSPVVVASGGSALVNSGTALYSASSNKQQQLASNATTTVGQSVDIATDSKPVRNLWLRTE